jgi:deoxycytidylate deaminase
MENLFKLATEVAESSPSKKKVGAILLKKNRVLVCATNNEKKTHPLQAHWAQKVGRPQKIYLHAELSALVKSKEDGDKIVVARLGGHKQNELRMAKPCPICEAYLRECGIKDVYYSVTNNKWSYEHWED